MRARAVAIAILTTTLAVVGAGYLATHAGKSDPERLVIGDSRQIMSALLYVAQAEGVFERNGLDVEIRGFHVGLEAVEAALSGAIDLGASSEVPISL